MLNEVLLESGKIEEIIFDKVQKGSSSLSVRAQNVIDSLIRYNSSKLLLYVFNIESIINERNVGVKTQSELFQFLNNIRIEIENQFPQSISLLGLIPYENPEIDFERYHRHKPIVLKYIHANRTSLSVRAFHAIDKLISKDFYLFLKYVYGINPLDNIDLIGKATIPSLKIFFESLKQVLEERDKLEDIYEGFLFDFKITFLNYPKIVEFIDEKLQNFSRKEFPIFSFYEVLLSNLYFLTERETEILFKLNGVFGRDKESLTQIASKVNLTRERVRQLGISIGEKLEERISAFQTHIDNSHEYSTQYLQNNFIVVDEVFVEKVNFHENSSYDLQEVTFLFKMIFHQFSQLVINNKENSYGYFIKASILEIFDFQKFISELDDKVNQRHCETFELNFEGFIYKFLWNKNITDLERIKPICELIVYKKYGKIVDLEGNLGFENNRDEFVKKVHEIFEYRKVPLKIDEIQVLLSKQYPELDFNLNKLRVILRDKDFCYIGRSSTYFPKSWEKAKSNLKGGTIRSIVFNLLTKKAKPVEIESVVSHVKRYRKTDYNSIITNLKLDSKKRFVFVDGKVILKEYEKI